MKTLKKVLLSLSTICLLLIATVSTISTTDISVSDTPVQTLDDKENLGDSKNNT